MTMFLVDIAAYQGRLLPEDVHRAGINAINLKISHGLGRTSVHPDVAPWAAKARTLGLGISTFHYLTTAGTGEEQAEHAYAAMTELSLEDVCAHQLDVEASPAPPLATVRGYLTRMTALLGRPVALYTGDWWWAARGGWNVSDLTPYLWAAPNRGYLHRYPGDGAAEWRAGYGGWPALAVMQYAVGPLTFPGGGRGDIDVSKSAIRDTTVWRDLTEGRPGMTYAPETLKAARDCYIDLITAAGYPISPLSVGIVADDSHQRVGTSYHLGKSGLRDDAYSIIESPRDRAGLSDAAAGIDLGWFSITVDGVTHTLRTFSVWLVDQCQAETADTADIREVIFSADGKTVRRWDRLRRRTTGDSSHLTHTHVSYFRDSEKRDKTALYKRYFTEIGALMPTAAQIVDELMSRTVKAGATNFGSVNGVLATLMSRSNEIRMTTLPAHGAALTKILGNVTADDGETAKIIAAIQAAQTDTVHEVLTGLGIGQSDAEVAQLLQVTLGTRAKAVAQLIVSS